MENNVLVCEGPTEGHATTVSSFITAPQKNERPHGHGMQKILHESPTEIPTREGQEELLLPQATEHTDEHYTTTAKSNDTSSVSVQVQQLIEHHQLTRSQLLTIYDNYEASKSTLLTESNETDTKAQSDNVVNLLSSEVALPAEDKIQSESLVEIDTDKESEMSMETEESKSVECDLDNGVKEKTSPAVDSESIFSAMPPQVNKMQNLVISAMETMSHTSGITLSEIGQKRKHFTLEDELKVQLSPFVEQLLERDQTVIAHVIKRYMNQYSIPQREVVEITGLNQSHLSQHFLHGVTMKRAKRVKLYQWFEDDQKSRTGKVQNTDGNLSAVLDSPRVEGSRRRPRWKWSPISTQILTEAFKKNQFPTRDQRLELSRICNEAEVAMNNGALARGPEGDTEGITEQRVNTWFTNRRKGLGTPITPPPSKASTPGAGTPLFASMLHPTLLRAGPATTPILTSSRSISSPFKPPNSSLGSPLTAQLAGLADVSSTDKNKARSLSNTPTTVQTLVSQIQESQVNQAQQASAVHQLMTRPQMALPVAIALPGNMTHTNLLSSHTGNAITSPIPRSTPVHSVTVPFSISPTLISPSQVQALISQFHSPFTPQPQVNLPLTTTSRGSPVQPHDAIRILRPSKDTVNSASISPLTSVPPLSVQTVTVASDQSPIFQQIVTNPSQTTSDSPQRETNSHDRGQLLQQTPLHLPAGNFVLNPSQVQALVNQIQAQQRIGDGQNVLVSSQPQFQLMTLPGFTAITTGSETD